MEIYLDKLDSITQTKYKEFKEKVQELLITYQETDSERFNLVKDKIEHTNGNWDTTIDLISGNSRESVDISQLLAYEYCLASERITKGKVSFEAALDKLFNGVQKFRIGNPQKGKDDECLYGKSLDDETAIPVTSSKYRLVMPAGAQYLQYFHDGKLTGAVFIYKKGLIKGIAKDENGNPVNIHADGIDFDDLRHGQSLLTNLRQTAFHEWTHNAEKEVIDSTSPTIDYEYQSVDGKTYRNYEIINSCVTADNLTNIQEPQYIISTQRDSQGNRKKYFQDKNGNLRPLSEVKFGLDTKQLGIEYCFSSGLTTREVMPDGETRMHNIITEGFVEETARAMIRAIDPQVRDIDEEKYPEYVEMAKRVIESRDVNLGENGQGQTYADFLMHSSELKRDLESRTVVLDDGSKVDGLHYISNYADRVQIYRNMPNVADFVDILEKEAEFFDGIAEKLGYLDRKIKVPKDTQKLVKEAIEGLPDFTLVNEIERKKEEARQQIANSNKRESQGNTL